MRAAHERCRCYFSNPLFSTETTSPSACSAPPLPILELESGPLNHTKKGTKADEECLFPVCYPFADEEIVQDISNKILTSRHCCLPADRLDGLQHRDLVEGARVGWPSEAWGCEIDAIH